MHVSPGHRPNRPIAWGTIRRTAAKMGLGAFIGWTILVSGCSGRSHPTKVVQGTVTFRGQAPPQEGEIFFAPRVIAGGLPQRPAQGTFDASGHFTLTSWEPGDGVVPGTYQVTIVCWREIPTLATKLSANYVPADFVPEITIDATAREPVAVTIDVPVLQGSKK